MDLGPHSEHQRLPRGPSSLPRVGIVVPVHNEEHLLGGALRGLGRAADHAEGAYLDCRIVVVLDGCTDGSAREVDRWRRRSSVVNSKVSVEVVTLQASCVGVARHAGCTALLRGWNDRPATDATWIATTDGDSLVPANWISAQLQMLEQGVDLWAGTVAVRDWTDRLEGTAQAWTHSYLKEEFPVHGANLGISGATYLNLGGFDRVPTGEDRALVDRALVAGAVVRHHHGLRVVTSGRRKARAPRGFAHALARVESVLADGSGALAGAVAP